MAIIKCKMCGGDVELAPDKTFGTCDYCGSTMTFPKVDDEQRAAAFNRGNHFRRIGEFDKALAVYERIVADADADAEAHWCCALCRFGIEYVEDPTTYEYIPTCHRASFDSILEDVDYLAAVEHSDGITRRQYQKDAAKIAEVQRGILATSQHEEPFDVFICYKETDDATRERTRDSLDAQEIYYQLTEKGYRVFFSRITLEDKAGAEYEPYIFAALNSARVMIALGSRPEHFNAVWVKNEWSRFLALMKKDRSRLLLPCYRGMDPYDLPEQLSVLQSYDMGKIGFMQDLIRGVEKVLRRDEPKPQSVSQPVVQQAVQSGGTNAAGLLQRGNIALEDSDWKKAKELFDHVLDMEPKCAEAYLGLAMADAGCCNRKDFARCYTNSKNELDIDKRVARVKQFGGEDLKAWLAKLDEKLRAAREKAEEKERIAREEERIARKKAEKEERIAREKAEEEARIAREQIRPWQGLVAAGNEHTVGLKKGGTVVAVGYNRYGQCNVSDWRDIAAVSAGHEHTVGLKKDGTVVAVGDNKKGQCDVSDWTDIVAVAAGNEHTVGLKKDGTVVAVGINAFGQCDVSDWRDIVAVATGFLYTVGLKKDGTVVATGSSAGCNVSDWTDIVAVSASNEHTVGLKKDGTVVAVGMRYDDRCDVSGWTDIAAVAAGHTHTVGLKKDGTVVAVGMRYDDRCDVSGWTDIAAVAAGWNHTVGLKKDGTVVAVGINVFGKCDVSGWKLKSEADMSADYAAACAAQEAGTEEKLAKAANLFASLKDYRDSAERAEACRNAYKEEKAAREARERTELTAEREKLAAELPTLKGLFSGSKKAKMEARIAEIDAELAKL